MAQRNITECDRCRREIKDDRHDVKITGVKKSVTELCITCHRDLERFLDGEQLEVPP